MFNNPHTFGMERGLGLISKISFCKDLNNIFRFVHNTFIHKSPHLMGLEVRVNLVKHFML